MNTLHNFQRKNQISPIFRLACDIQSIYAVHVESPIPHTLLIPLSSLPPSPFKPRHWSHSKGPFSLPRGIPALPDMTRTRTGVKKD